VLQREVRIERLFEYLSIFPMQWTARFDEPIGLGTGKTLRTLRDAADHITALPRQVAELEHWQDAVACLIAAAEGKGPIITARIGVLRALSAERAPPERLAH
jgi:hypothetical protein